MDKTYSVDGLTFKARKIIVNQRDFVSWKNVWLLAQVLIVIKALTITVDMPIQALVAAFAILWVIYQTQKF